MGDYEATRKRHIEYLLPQVGEHFERVAWSAERLRAERAARLRELVEIAVQRSSWHRDRLGGLDETTLELPQVLWRLLVCVTVLVISYVSVCAWLAVHCVESGSQG
jgi:hypothetical protein